MTTKMYANAKLVEGFQIMLDDNEGHSYIADLEPEIGTRQGPSPLEFCVMSHVGCYAITCASIAKKMRLNLKHLRVKVEAVESEGAAATITEENFDITIKTDAPEDRVERLHKVTLENCSVGILFEKAGVKINYKINISKE